MQKCVGVFILQRWFNPWFNSKSKNKERSFLSFFLGGGLIESLTPFQLSLNPGQFLNW